MTAITCNNETTNTKTLPNLKTKSQLNHIVVNANGKPDHLAINIYWDTFRSWYNPNKIYIKDGNILTLNKLKTKGVYTNYQKLSEIHGVSKDAIRKKLIKLEKLELINRSFQHRQTVTTKSYNQLIIFVWQNTPFFFNSYGVNQEDAQKLNPYTSHNYIADKHNIVFTCNHQVIKSNKSRGGVRQETDTKELKNSFSKEKDRSIKKSNFVKKDFEEKTTQTKKPVYQKPKQLIDFYPLNKEECQKLQSSSGREFSLNAMNEILKNMSRRVKDRFFYSKKGFMAYMTKCFTFELRDAVAVSNNNFRITANQTAEESRAGAQEQYLAEIENSLQVSPEWHLKKKLASVLARETAYNLLKSYKIIIMERGKAKIQLTRQVDLTSTEEEIIKSQIRATYEGVGGTYNFLEEIEITMPEKTKLEARKYSAYGMTARVGIWGKVRETLAQVLGAEGEAIEKNWISKLEAQVNEDGQEISLKAKSNLVKDYVEDRYLGLIRNITKEQGFYLKW